MDDKLSKQFKNLREKNIQLIAVSNNEWYSLFRDEIRNSIAIEGIFSNRNDLLDVLEKNKKKRCYKVKKNKNKLANSTKNDHIG